MKLNEKSNQVKVRRIQCSIEDLLDFIHSKQSEVLFPLMSDHTDKFDDDLSLSNENVIWEDA